MITLEFDFTKKPPQIDIDRSKISKNDIHLLRVVFYQMSLGKKFLKKFTLEVSGFNLKITPIINENVKNIKGVQEVFKNLVKDVTLAYRDF